MICGPLEHQDHRSAWQRSAHHAEIAHINQRLVLAIQGVEVRRRVFVPKHLDQDAIKGADCRHRAAPVALVACPCHRSKVCRRDGAPPSPRPPAVAFEGLAITKAVFHQRYISSQTAWHRVSYDGLTENLCRRGRSRTAPSRAPSRGTPHPRHPDAAHAA